MTDYTDYKEKYGVDLDKEARRLAEIYEKEKAGAVLVTKQFTMTKSEFDKLSLNEMQALYEQYPKEVIALIRSNEP